jgi:uncharacterized membrane protein
MKKITMPSVIACLGLLFAIGTCFAQQDPSYIIFDVPGAISTFPASINNSRDVAGWFCTVPYCFDTDRRGFVREFNGNITTFDGVPVSINDAGAVAGYLFDSVGVHCFLRDQQGKITVFDVPQLNPSASGLAVAINNHGDVAGYLIPCMMCDTYEGFVRDKQGRIETFMIPRGAVPTSISARGDITGRSSDYYLAQDGFVRDRNGNITIFDVPGYGCMGPSAYPVSINNRGEVAGYFSDATHNCQRRGFVRQRNGNITAFDATPDASTTVASINDNGELVGQFSDANYDSHQFLRNHEGTITVFDVPNGLGATSVSVNNRDDVTGVFYDVQNGILAAHGFVRTK